MSQGLSHIIYLILQVTRASKPSTEGIDSVKFRCNVTPSVDCFRKSYFCRTVSQWNSLPINLRTRENVEIFETDLKKQMWLILGLEPD